MRIYARDQVCGFRYTRSIWGAFSNFQPLAVPIAADSWTFPTSEHAYQACKFPARPDVQQRIAEAPTAREAAAIGRAPGLRHRRIGGGDARTHRALRNRTLPVVADMAPGAARQDERGEERRPRRQSRAAARAGALASSRISHCPSPSERPAARPAGRPR